MSKPISAQKPVSQSVATQAGYATGGNLSPPLRPKHDIHRNRSFPTFRAVMALILREMSTTYGNSPGGYLWAILEPVAGLVMISIGFSLMFNTPPVGNSFPMFYATGFLPMMLFNDVANKMAVSIRFSRALLAYPVVSYLDALLARLLLTTLTHLMVAYLVFFSLIVVFDARSELDLPVVLLGFCLTALLGMGVGTVNCYFMTAFPIWERAWQIATRPLFLMSGIFFTYDDMPKLLQETLWYNPILHIVGLVRAGFYGSYRADYVSLSYVLAIAMLTLCIGLLLLWRHHRKLLES